MQKPSFGLQLQRKVAFKQHTEVRQVLLNNKIQNIMFASIKILVKQEAIVSTVNKCVAYGSNIIIVNYQITKMILPSVLCQ
ncbi:unnamed protein product [Rhizophagus irregularis]|nr:unnamed protein product [Rhizophagus irregularis]CAB5369796.1 unnamed protein product [Rhizophagus irregularis]